MPRLPIDYSKGMIYVIRCNDENVIDEYVGSSTEFTKRKYQHKNDTINEKSKGYNRKIYQTIRENGGWENWSMIMIEEYPCENKRQLEMREEQIRVERKASLNQIKAFISEKEKNDYRKIYNPLYYEKNREKCLEQKKEYYKNNIEQIKIYREENQEIIKIKSKEYETKNKEKRNAKKKIKINCVCGSIICTDKKNRHEKSQKHLDFIN
jgi:hypothetical protein